MLSLNFLFVFSTSLSKQIQVIKSCAVCWNKHTDILLCIHILSSYYRGFSNTVTSQTCFSEIMLQVEAFPLRTTCMLVHIKRGKSSSSLFGSWLVLFPSLVNLGYNYTPSASVKPKSASHLSVVHLEMCCNTPNIPSFFSVCFSKDPLFCVNVQLFLKLNIRSFLVSNERSSLSALFNFLFDIKGGKKDIPLSWNSFGWFLSPASQKPEGFYRTCKKVSDSVRD